MSASARIALALTVCALTIPAVALGGQSPPPTEHPVGLIYVHGARHGTLSPAKGSSFHLTLGRTAPQTLAFETTPARQSWQIPTRRLLAWAGLGFKHDPPNAVLSILHGDPNADTLAVRLTNPRKENHGRRVTYLARPIDAATGNLANFDSQLDKRVPRRFGAASVFIDDASGPFVPCTKDLCGTGNDCVIQPFTQCPGADLSGFQLNGVNLLQANLAGATLINTELAEAILFQADLSRANLTGADLTRTNLGFAKLGGADLSASHIHEGRLGAIQASNARFLNADLSGADLTRANLTGADMSGADMSGVFLTRADLTGANLSGADLTGAHFCVTTMPNGRINDDDC